jgi:4'-phosphopantetheinyl transferase
MESRLELFWSIQRMEDVAQNSDWLTPGEISRLEKMRFIQRRANWLLGRWTAKNALSAYLRNSRPVSSLSEIEIQSADDGAPEAFVGGASAPVTISISHSARIGFCAIGAEGISLGCDLEMIETRSGVFVQDYFTPEEQALVMEAGPGRQPLLATLIWSAKESALKALRQGLRIDTRNVSAHFPANDSGENWCPLSVQHAESSSTFHGWWRMWGEFVQTIVADPQPRIPMPADKSL